MKNKRYLFFALMLIVCILTVSAVSAEDTPANDIISDNEQSLPSDESIQEDISANAKNEEPASEMGTSSDLSNDEKINKENKNLDSQKDKKIAENKKANEFKTISRGSKDKAMVKKIQKALKKNGYYLKYKGHYLKVDGCYGWHTYRSVKQFQKAKKLKVTGKVDKKTAEKLKIIDNTNAKIKLYGKKTFITEYNSGKSFTAKVINKTTGKGISTLLQAHYYKKGFDNYEYYYTDDDGKNYITPNVISNNLKIGTYKVKVSSADSKVKANPVTKTIKVVKTSLRLKANDAIVDGNQNLKLNVNLKFKNNKKVNEGKIKFSLNGKSYIVKVRNGLATKTIKVKNLKSKKYKVTFLGTKNIKAKSVTGKIA